MDDTNVNPNPVLDPITGQPVVEETPVEAPVEAPVVEEAPVEAPVEETATPEAE